MAKVRVQARFSQSLPPGGEENVCVNTFHFFHPSSSYSVHRDLALEAVRKFYEEDSVAHNASLGAWMAPTILRPWEARAYDLDTAEPRIPTIDANTLPASAFVNTQIPQEIAVCLSFHGSPPVTARRRGRIYLPGISAGFLTVGDATQPCIVALPDGAAVQDLCTSAQILGDSDDVGWSVYSPTANTFTRVVGGWVDNAPDVQRRRGFDATEKRIWLV